jgi:hypothetical protein
MINVQQITSRLARLPDQALQQYAAMHKNDPYIMALALSESNRRKQMREGAQTGASEQPKVVDQEIANMAAPMPEDVGIGQLPAGDMNFASGGIVAFGDGGEVERYQSQGLVQPPTYGTPYAIPGMVQPPRAIIQQAGAPENTPLFQRLFQSARSEGERYRLAQAQQRIAMGTATQADRDLVAKAALPDMGAASLDEQAAINAAIAAPTRPAPTAKSSAPKAAPGADTGAAGARPAAAAEPKLLGGPGTAAAAPATGIAGLASTPSTMKAELAAFMPQGKVADPYAAEIAELGAEGIAAAKTRKEMRERQLEEMGLYGVEQEKRLREREGRVAKQERDVGPLAMLQAGLAMMSGSSPYALQNIGIGAQTGLKTYSEGIDKIESARDKLDEAFGRIDAARRSERILTDREKAELQSDYDKSKIEAKKLAVAGAQQAYGWARQDAGKAFDAYAAEQRLGAELQSKERLAREQIKAQKEIAAGRNAMMEKLYGGDVRARAEFGKVQQQVLKELAANPMYANEADEAKKTVMYETSLRRALQANPFLSAYAAGIGFTKTPPAGKVLDLTE